MGAGVRTPAGPRFFAEVFSSPRPLVEPLPSELPPTGLRLGWCPWSAPGRTGRQVRPGGRRSSLCLPGSDWAFVPLLTHTPARRGRGRFSRSARRCWGCRPAESHPSHGGVPSGRPGPLVSKKASRVSFVASPLFLVGGTAGPPARSAHTDLAADGRASWWDPYRGSLPQLWRGKPDGYLPTRSPGFRNGGGTPSAGGGRPSLAIPEGGAFGWFVVGGAEVPPTWVRLCAQPSHWQPAVRSLTYRGQRLS